MNAWSTFQLSELGLKVCHTDLTRVWLWRSHTAMFPSEQQEKQTLASGLMASA